MYLVPTEDHDFEQICSHDLSVMIIAIPSLELIRLNSIDHYIGGHYLTVCAVVRESLASEPELFSKITFLVYYNNNFLGTHRLTSPL